MQFAHIGYYTDRNKARVPIDKQLLQSVYGRRVERLRVEALDGFIVLTDPQDAQYRGNYD